MGALYLRKASDELVSHCACEGALVTSSAQMDCPWCGCGWLFTCVQCRRAFTFATAIEIDRKLEDVARDDLRAHGCEPTDEDVHDWIEEQRVMMDGIEASKRYVYFDGYALPAIDDSMTVEGIHGLHDLPWIPQVQALKDPGVLRSVLTSRAYWAKVADAAESARKRR